MNKDQKKVLLNKLTHLYAEVHAIHQHIQASKILDVSSFVMEPLMNHTHALMVTIEKVALEEPSKDGLYWAMSARCKVDHGNNPVYHLVLVTGDQVQGILDECPRPIADSQWTDYKPASIKDPVGRAWIPNL